MLFVPPRCPNPACDRHLNPTPGFFVRRGYYQPACRRERVPRFRCRTCNRGFSRQTFRQDYRDRRPADNAILFMLLASGVGLRQAGRVLKMNARSVQDKKCKMARMLALLHENLSQTLPKGSCFLLDEEETYEGASIRPLTMPVMIEKETWFVVATAVGSIRRLAPPGSARRVRQDWEERDGQRVIPCRRCPKFDAKRIECRVPFGTPLRKCVVAATEAHLRDTHDLRVLELGYARHSYGKRIIELCGGSWTGIEPLVDDVRDALRFARMQGEIRLSAESREWWGSSLYAELEGRRSGLFGEATRRASPSTS